MTREELENAAKMAAEMAEETAARVSAETERYNFLPGGIVKRPLARLFFGPSPEQSMVCCDLYYLPTEEQKENILKTFGWCVVEEPMTDSVGQ